MNKPSTAEDYKLLSSFYDVRKKLLGNGHQDRLEKPLAYWALPSDRRLPLALLGKTVKDILQTPFEQLSATPGIGRKKIHSLVDLLDRATNSEPSGSEDNNGAGHASCTSAKDQVDPTTNFDADAVSEAVWERWKATVRQHNLGSEKLGMVAPSLCNLPTVIWDRPIHFYLDHSLADIRNLKTHGEKRVRAVLEIFWAIHRGLSSFSGDSHFSVKLVPQFVARLENWIACVLDDSSIPSLDVLHANLVQPLVDQIEIDGGSTIHELVASRLGVKEPRESVRSQSRKMGVTRARVYQLLDECAKIMAVRWPAGDSSTAKLAEHLAASDADPKCLQAIEDLRRILFPAQPELDS